MAINRTVFISGANRGIGYELTGQMADNGFIVIAGYRNKDRSEKLLDDASKDNTILPFQVDVTVEADLESLKQFIAKKFGYLDIVINNAGINAKQHTSLNELEWSNITQNVAVNLGGPFLTTKYLYPLLLEGREKKIINITSKMGSISLSGAGAVPYRISKAALNMLTKNQSVEYKSDGVTVVAVHPGWVKTDMGGDSAPLSGKESAQRILRILNQITVSQSGQFLDIDGDVLPY